MHTLELAEALCVARARRSQSLNVTRIPLESQICATIGFILALPKICDSGCRPGCRERLFNDLDKLFMLRPAADRHGPAARDLEPVAINFPAVYIRTSRRNHQHSMLVPVEGEPLVLAHPAIASMLIVRATVAQFLFMVLPRLPGCQKPRAPGPPQGARRCFNQRGRTAAINEPPVNAQKDVASTGDRASSGAKFVKTRTISGGTRGSVSRPAGDPDRGRARSAWPTHERGGLLDAPGAPRYGRRTRILTRDPSRRCSRG